MPDSSNRNRARRRPQQQPRPLRVAQGNVRKSSPAHTAFLQLCAEEQIDIVLVQEPWLKTGPRWFHNSHPAYKIHIPLDGWNTPQTQPRVATYIRKDSSLKVEQVRPWSSCRDILWLEIDRYTIINVYKPPVNGGYSLVTSYLLGIQPPANTLVAGDFNAKHELWQPEITSSRNDGREIAEWATNADLTYTGEAGQPTHREGNTIDLAFSNVPFATTIVEDKLHLGADHEALVTTLLYSRRTKVKQRRPTVAEDRLETFNGLVRISTDSLPPLPTNATADDIDTATEALLEALAEASGAVQKEPNGKNQNAPWWTERCREARRDYHQARRQGNGERKHKYFHRVIREEK